MTADDRLTLDGIRAAMDRSPVIAAAVTEDVRRRAGGPAFEPYVSTAEIARLFSIPEKTVRQYAQAGRLPALRYPNGKWGLRPTEVEAALQAA